MKIMILQVSRSGCPSHCPPESIDSSWAESDTQSREQQDLIINIESIMGEGLVTQKTSIAYMASITERSVIKRHSNRGPYVMT